MFSKKEKIFTIILLLITIFLININFASTVFASDNLEARSSIQITGDNEFTAANGVVSGSGSPNNPYIIGGWKIFSESGHGILIKNTRKHFVIENNLIENAGVKGERFDNHYGIYLENLKNAKLKNNLIRFNFSGVALDNSSEISLVGNSIRSNYIGGITVFGVARKDNLYNNKIIQNGLVGITTFASENTFITNNTIARNGNKIYENVVKIENPSRKYRAVHSGIFLLASQYTLVKNNIISSNQGYGIAISSYSFLPGNIVVGNTISGNENYGVYLATRTRKNMIYHNSFINNEGENSQAYDNGVNSWDNGYSSGGNYWSDYEDQDQKKGKNQSISGSDGIGDVSYSIDGLKSKDNYPLVESTSKKYSLTLRTEPENAGTVSGGGSYYEGESILVEAESSSFYDFDYWSGDLSGSKNPREILIDSNKTVVAHFFKTKKSEIIPVSGGTIEIKKAKINIPSGALQSKTKITMERAEEVSPKGLEIIGPSFVFSPKDLDFESPVEVILPYDDELIPKGVSEDNLSVYRFNSELQNLGGDVSVENNNITVTVENLGKFAVFAEFFGPEEGSEKDDYSLFSILLVLLSFVFLMVIMFLVYKWKFSSK